MALTDYYHSYTSQFEQVIRCTLGLPLGNPLMKVPYAIMINVLGIRSSIEDTWKIMANALEMPNAYAHWYGKSGSIIPGRKVGHITITGDTSGTWLTTNGIGIAVYFGLGVGSTKSGTAGAWVGAQIQYNTTQIPVNTANLITNSTDVFAA